MTTLDVTRAEIAFLVMYLNKAETRDKICRAIQYGSKFLSAGEPGVAQNVDKTTSLARKVFRLAKVRRKYVLARLWKQQYGDLVEFSFFFLVYVCNVHYAIFETSSFVLVGVFGLLPLVP